MFERKKYKNLAKKMLQKNFKAHILVCAICLYISIFCTMSFLLIYSNVAFFDFSSNFFSDNIFDFNFSADFSELSKFDSLFLFASEILLICIQGIFPLALSFVFLKSLELKIAQSSTPNPELESQQKNFPFSNFLQGLSFAPKGIFAGILQTFWTTLWSLLFIIPGIVKSVAYSEMFFALAENKSISASKGLRISKILTEGHKSDLFLMRLSFLPWIFLCLLPHFIFGFFLAEEIFLVKLLALLISSAGFSCLMPYIFATEAIAYKVLKIEAMERGKIKPSDFE